MVRRRASRRPARRRGAPPHAPLPRSRRAVPCLRCRQRAGRRASGAPARPSWRSAPPTTARGLHPAGLGSARRVEREAAAVARRAQYDAEAAAAETAAAEAGGGGGGRAAGRAAAERARRDAEAEARGATRGARRGGGGGGGGGIRGAQRVRSAREGRGGRRRRAPLHRAEAGAQIAELLAGGGRKTDRRRGPRRRGAGPARAGGRKPVYLVRKEIDRLRVAARRPQRKCAPPRETLERAHRSSRHALPPTAAPGERARARAARRPELTCDKPERMRAARRKRGDKTMKARWCWDELKI